MSESEKNPAENENFVEENTEILTEEAAMAQDENEEPELIAESEESEDATPATDYAELAREDMRELIALFPHLRGKESVAELDNPLRYAALRDLGLTPKEAYLATNGYNRGYDNRSHLRSAVPKPAAASCDMLDARGLEAARELFAGLSDREIQRLYKKVSK